MACTHRCAQTQIHRSHELDCFTSILQIFRTQALPTSPSLAQETPFQTHIPTMLLPLRQRTKNHLSAALENIREADPQTQSLQPFGAALLFSCVPLLVCMSRSAFHVCCRPFVELRGFEPAKHCFASHPSSLPDSVTTARLDNPACQMPLCGATGIRTPDPLLAKQVL